MNAIRKMIVGRIEDRQVAVDVVLWTGWLYYGCAGALAIVALGSIAPWIVGMSICFVACGYFIGSKVSRAAAIMGFLLIASCFVILPIVMPTMVVMLILPWIEWAAVRSVDATFKLHGKFVQQGQGGVSAR